MISEKSVNERIFETIHGGILSSIVAYPNTRRKWDNSISEKVDRRIIDEVYIYTQTFIGNVVYENTECVLYAFTTGPYLDRNA